MNNESNANETWNRFEEIFNSTVYSHAPLRKMTKKERKLQNKPWITRAILQSSQTQRKMYEQCICNKNSTLTIEYKTYCNKLT